MSGHERIEDSEYPPPMLESEKSITERVTKWGDRSMFLGFLTSSLYCYKHLTKMQQMFSKAGLRIWQVGPISLIAGFSFGAKYLHWSLYAPKIFNELPEGYYRRIYVEKMDRSIPTKRAYFDDHPAELKSRYKMLGIDIGPKFEMKINKPESGWR